MSATLERDALARGAGDAGAGRRRQAEIYAAGVGGRRPPVPLDPQRLQDAAARAMSAEAFAYIAGGAGAEATVRANRRALERTRIVQRVLRDVSARDTSTTLFGTTLPSPMLLAPIGALELCHPHADSAVARAAAAERVPMVISNQASVPMEQLVAAMGDAARWFQLYWSSDDDLMRSLVRRAEASGCSAIVLTLDTTMLGWRVRDLELGHLPFLHARGIAQYTSDPVFRRLVDAALAAGDDQSERTITPTSIAAFVRMCRRYPGGFVDNLRSGRPIAGVRRFVDVYSRTSLQWSDLATLRELTALPILLKGIVHPDDARMALEHGMDGVIVSNHGGRQVDGAVAALDVLPQVVDAVAGRAPVLFDSGVRTGADVFKALALGARAVLVGRPYAYGLALAGELGVREVLRNLHAELDLTMGLAGRRTVAEIGDDAVIREAT